MTTDVSKRLFGPAALTNAAATIYTATGVKAQIVHIEVHNTSASPITVTVSIGADALGTRIHDRIALGALGDYESRLDDTCLYVLDPGEIIQAFASTTGVAVMSIHGVETA